MISFFTNPMRLGFASDHAGFELKECLVKLYIEKYDLAIKDFGCSSIQPCDYPDFAKAVGKQVLQNNIDVGILICGTGIGMSIAANRLLGIRAALCQTQEYAILAREHNNANILCLGARFLTIQKSMEIIDKFICTKFQGGRHVDRIKKTESL